MNESGLSLDIIIPSYRVSLETLTPFLNVKHPGDMDVKIFLVIDNPDKLLKLTRAENISRAAVRFAKKLLEQGSQNLPESKLKLLCNERNIGAAKTRNVGLDTSCADYVLFLDDDVIPDENILYEYRTQLLELENEGKLHQVAGIMGPCIFPRNSSLPLKHAAFLVRNLQFIFESPLIGGYNWAQWGVTANLLIPRPKEKIRFDTSFSRIGGEDIDFCLSLSEENGKRFHSLPSARVEHPFWNGTAFDLMAHFFSWSLNDSKIFSKYPQYLIRGPPNLPETIFLSVLPVLLFYKRNILCAVWTVSVMFIFNAITDLFSHHDVYRIQLDQYQRPFSFYVAAFFLGTLYVFAIECGSLYSHLKSYKFLNIGKRILLNRNPSDDDEDDDVNPQYINIELVKFSVYMAILYLSVNFLF